MNRNASIVLLRMLSLVIALYFTVICFTSCGGGGGGGGNTVATGAPVIGQVLASNIKGAKICVDATVGSANPNCAFTDGEGNFTLPDATGQLLSVWIANVQIGTVQAALVQDGMIISPETLAGDDSTKLLKIMALFHQGGVKSGTTDNESYDLSGIQNIDPVAFQTYLNGSGSTLTIGTTTVDYNNEQSSSNPPSCTYSLSLHSGHFAASGETKTVYVDTQLGCSWNVTNIPGWLTITPAAGKNGGSFTATAKQNSIAGGHIPCLVNADGMCLSGRAAGLNINGQTYYAVQWGSAYVSANGGGTCTFALSSTSSTVGSNGGGGTVTVTASDSVCAWTTASNDNWITVSAGTSGNDTATYTVAANSGAAQRTGTLTIAGMTFTVTQAGTAGGGTAVTVFNGSYTGTYTGTCTAAGISAPVNGSVALTVNNGAITVTAPAAGTGTVQSGGGATLGAAGGGSNYTFSGTFNGNSSGSGSWTATPGTCSGTWSVTNTLNSLITQ